MNTFDFLGSGGVKALLVCGLLSAVAMANAEWTVVRLNPPGSGGSQAFGVGGGQQVGNALLGSTRKAVLWTGTNHALSLDPLLDGSSNATDTDGVFQVGNVSHPTYGGKSHAALWQGTASSYLDLNPAGATESFATGLADGVQVGRARIAGVVHAGRWTGSSASWVDLHPEGASDSLASGVGDGQQVGRATIGGISRAGLWTGTAQSWVDLNPQGANNSAALAASQGRQVGSAFIGGVSRPGYWTGTAESWVDLSQPGWTGGGAAGVWGDTQVGVAGVGGLSRASLWKGTSDSWVDLHAYLPSIFSESQASAVWQSGGRTYVTGYGNNQDNGEALLWISDVVPESDGVVVLGLGIGFFLLPLLRARGR